MERVKGNKIKLEIDQDEVYDYEEAKSLIFKNKFQMLQVILEEAREMTQTNYIDSKQSQNVDHD